MLPLWWARLWMREARVSNHLITAAYKANLRTPMRKAVMVLLADKASDDGSGIWASKQTMADELCCSKQTVIDTIKGFIADGLLVEDGTRKSPNGFTVQYRIIVSALNAIPLVNCHSDQSRKLTGQPAGPVNEADPTGQPAGPEPSRTPLPQKASPSSGSRAKTPRFRMPDDWKPVRFADDTVAREIIDRRGRDWGRAALESFRNWAANADDRIGRKADWQKAWGKWVIEQDKRDGNRSDKRMDGQPGLRGSRPDPSLDLYRNARAAEEAQRAAGGGQDNWGTWPALPAIGSG